MTIGLPSAPVNCPRKPGVAGSGLKTLIVPSPKLPTSKSPAKPLNDDGAIANPHGELSVPIEPIRPRKFPCRSKARHEAVAGTRDIVVLGGILQGVGHVDPVPEDLDVEGCEAGGGARVGEFPGQVGRAGVPLEHVDLPGTKVRRQEIAVPARGIQGGALVDVVRSGELKPLGRGPHGTPPSRDGPVLADEQEEVRSGTPSHWRC